MLSVGQLPELSYIACHREERRVQLLVAVLKTQPDLAETCTLAAELARQGLLPRPCGARARRAEFLKRCQAALKIKNPLAELDVSKLPREDQRAVALALDPGKKICSRCPNAANTALEFSLAWSEIPSSACSCADGLAVCKCVVAGADPRIEWYCAGCAQECRVVVCARCKTGDQTIKPWSSHGPHQLLNARCTKCSRPTFAPSSSKDRRKYDENLADIHSHKRKKLLCAGALRKC